MKGSPRQLDDGTWGAIIYQDTGPEPGELVQIETREGKRWEQEVDRVHLTTCADDGRPYHVVSLRRKARNGKPASPVLPALPVCNACGGALGGAQLEDRFLVLRNQVPCSGRNDGGPCYFPYKRG